MDNAAKVEFLRQRLDTIDHEIADLIAERAEVSRLTQWTKVGSGGSRIDLAREREVIANYTQYLGDVGPDFARAVLASCRGKVGDVDAPPKKR